MYFIKYITDLSMKHLITNKKIKKTYNNNQMTISNN